jgi:undecaprenyl-diphosphatase
MDANITENSALPRPKMTFLGRYAWLWILAGCALLLATLFLDNALLRRGVGLRFSWLDGLMLYLTDFGMFFFAVLLTFILVIQKKWRWLSLLALSLVISFEFSYLLKLIFQSPRPYFNLEIAIIPLTQASGYSFPSLHSAFCIGIIPFLDKIFRERWKQLLGVALAVIIALSRAYLGVHYFSDILAGGMIGYLLSRLAIFVELRYDFTNWFLGHVKSKLELRRQIAHLVIGAVIVFLIELRLMTVNLMFIILILGLLLSLAYRYHPIPLIHELLQIFERPKDINSFPGRGPIFLVLGSLLALLFFPINIAKAAIVILAVGDSVSHLVGRYFGKTRVPLSKNKMLEGTVVAIIFSTLSALLFVDIGMAFVASLLTVCVESVYPEKIAHYFDDNLLVPLLAGFIMLMMT